MVQADPDIPKLMIFTDIPGCLCGRPQVGQDDLVLTLAGPVVGHGDHRHPGHRLDFPGHGLGNESGTAECRICLDEEGKSRMVFEDMEDFQEVVVGLPAVIGLHMEGLKVFLKGAGTDLFLHSQDAFEVTGPARFDLDHPVGGPW